jgi:hypothetical protein
MVGPSPGDAARDADAMNPGEAVTVELTVTDSVAEIVLSRPEKLNAKRAPGSLGR